MPIKYQYYQSEDCLNISVLAKGLLAEEVGGRESGSEGDGLKLRE
jgi:hypothetical protein